MKILYVQKILTRKIFHIVRCFKSDKCFTVRVKNILQSDQQQRVHNFFSKKTLNAVRCLFHFNDSLENWFETKQKKINIVNLICRKKHIS